MTLRCSRTSEIVAMVERGHWPLACPPELRAHLDRCRSCSEVLAVTETLRQARAAASAQAQLPPPGVLWWRAQLRRRNAAVERVSRPILGAYLFALATLVMVAVVFFVEQARHGFSWFDRITLPQMPASAEVLDSAGWSLLILLPVFATIVLIGAVVVYFKTERQ